MKDDYKKPYRPARGRPSHNGVRNQRLQIGEDQAKVLAALNARDWGVSDLADAGQVQAPMLIEWLESTAPAPTWIHSLVKRELGIYLPIKTIPLSGIARRIGELPLPKPIIAAKPNKPKPPPPAAVMIKDTQIQMIRSLLAKRGWDEATFVQKAGKAIAELARSDARDWISRLTYETAGKPAQNKLPPE